MPRRLSAAARAFAVLALLGAAPAAAQQDDPGAGVEIAQTERIRAMVLTVDREARQILMRNLATGDVFVHRPPEGMGDGALSVESGDIVEALVTRGITARPAEPEDARRTEERRMAAPAASAGGAGFVGGTLRRSVVTLEAWNAVTDVAVARTPEGRMERYKVTTDEGRAFLDALEVGDRIEVEFSDTVVVMRPGGRE